MGQVMTGDGDKQGQAVAWLGHALGLAEGQEPFPWQVELLRRLLRGDCIEALDIPTGLGKTAVIATWLVARASGANVPRRLVYVVDRRAVVDQATDVAEGLRAWVAREPTVTRALGLEGRKLPISTLRGQHVDNRAWLEDPSAPAIIIGTVDMIGSRLLFSGYGVSSKMRPFQAGLLGVDALIVLDEAHLSAPFERLLEQIASGVDAAGRSLRLDPTLGDVVPQFRCLSLSATGRERDATRVLRLTEADRRPGGVVAKRLDGVKRLAVRSAVSDKELPEALAAEAWALADEGKAASRTIVFCTSRDHAQKVQEALRKLAKGQDGAPPTLFVGGRRVYERELAASRLRELGFLAGSSARPERATFVIATAAGEVGVDLDADHAVCDLVAWERMVQRLGRVNRRGERDAQVIVVPYESPDEAEEGRRGAVRALLAELPERGGVDVSLAALTALKERAASDPRVRDLMTRATTPAPLHPPLTRALVEAWSMTSLEEHTGRPEVAPWIRGWLDEEEPQTTLVWRRFLPITAEGDVLSRRELEAFRDAADPHLAEKLETETWRVIAWLERRLRGLGSKDPTDEGMLASTDVVAVVLDPKDRREALVHGDDLATSDRRDRLKRALAGTTVVLDRRLGGLRDGLLADDADEPVVDVSDVEGTLEERIVPFRVRRVTSREESAATDGWRTEVTIPVERSDEGETAWLVVESVVAAGAESEEGRSGAKRAQLLAEHQEWTEAEAKGIADRLALPKELGELLAAAARLHDEGKRARIWQRAFHVPSGGDPPYAKSTTSRPDLTLLGGYRHELGSLPYAEAHPRVKELPGELRALCLHLIAAHHGSARPLIRTAGAEEPPTRLVERAREIALRFTRLEERWGPWGLAWWEALLRASDQRASRRNDSEDARGHGRSKGEAHG